MKRALWWIPAGFAFTDAIASVNRIKGDSMIPTLNASGRDTDVVIVEKISAKLYKFTRGDVVLVKSPENPSRTLVKRLIGIDGDWISVGGGRVVKVPQGQCWLEGDNPGLSRDSRTSFGPVPLALIEGRVIGTIWPSIGALPPSPKPPRGSRVVARSSTSTVYEMRADSNGQDYITCHSIYNSATI